MTQYPSGYALERRPSSGQVRQMRVVLAVPDARLRAAMAEALRQDGYEVVEFEDGAFVADYLVDRLFAPHRAATDAFVLDVSLPVVSGLELLDGLRSFDGRTPCVVLAASVDAGLYRRAERLGGVVLEETGSVDSLVAVVGSLIDRAER